eukprot:356133-Chlamydomonas_euryale.AAC.6
MHRATAWVKGRATEVAEKSNAWALRPSVQPCLGAADARGCSALPLALAVAVYMLMAGSSSSTPGCPRTGGGGGTKGGGGGPTSMLGMFGNPTPRRFPTRWPGQKGQASTLCCTQRRPTSQHNQLP